MESWNQLSKSLLEHNHIKIPLEKRFFLSFLEEDSEHINKRKVIDEIHKLGFLPDDPRLIKLRSNFQYLTIDRTRVLFCSKKWDVEFLVVWGDPITSVNRIVRSTPKILEPTKNPDRETGKFV